ncbi:MAG: hypothetical protein ACRCXZ_02015 [Patescibacteria group bacterium]
MLEQFLSNSVSEQIKFGLEFLNSYGIRTFTILPVPFANYSFTRAEVRTSYHFIDPKKIESVMDDLNIEGYVNFRIPTSKGDLFLIGFQNHWTLSFRCKYFGSLSFPFEFIHFLKQSESEEFAKSCELSIIGDFKFTDLEKMKYIFECIMESKVFRIH